MRIRATSAWALVALGAIGTLVLLCWRSSSAEVVYPVERARLSFIRQVGSRLAGLWNGAEAGAENVRLRRELASLEVLRTELAGLERENARLRSLLDYTARRPKLFLPAAILSSEGGAAAARPTIRVDRGSRNGVMVGAVVLAPSGLVGRVTAVSPHTSEVSLLPDPSVRVACEIDPGSPLAVRAVLSGGGAEALVLRYLSQPEGVRPGARVITSGRGGVFPRGIDVGTISPDGTVRPSVDFSALEDVFICREE